MIETAKLKTLIENWDLCSSHNEEIFKKSIGDFGKRLEWAAERVSVLAIYIQNEVWKNRVFFFNHRRKKHKVNNENRLCILKKGWTI